METTHFSADYSDVYDAFHQGKPYNDEVDFVLNLYKAQEGQAPSSVVDLACGTGKHLALLANKVAFVHGNDLSEGMLGVAKKRLGERSPSSAEFSCGPMQALHARGPDGGFDLALTFYTALGYLTETDQLDEFFKNLRKVLRPGGYFFADNWNGHRMSRDFSPERVRSVDTGHFWAERKSLVSHLPNQNSLSVNFRFTVLEPGQLERRFDETHLVRYFTPKEIESLLMAYGFKLISTGPFFEPENTLEDCWNFYTFAKLMD